MFVAFSKKVHSRFVEMSNGELFTVRAENIFDKYLAAFPKGTNPMFRTRTEYDCQCCKQFIKRLGITVAIKNAKLITVWGDLDIPEPFKTVADALDAYLRTRPIESVFRTKERKYGVDHNYDKDNQRYDHFYGEVGTKHYSVNADTLRGEQDSIFQVFKRGLNEINESDIASVLDLIESNALYRGEEHKPALLGFQSLLKDYKKAKKSELFIWENLSHKSSRFRNTVIGTLLTDLAEGKDIEVAVKAFETKVAPTNYKRTTSIITQKMVEEAIEKLNTLGLGGAIYRRFAKLSDVSVNDVLFVDNDTKGKMKDGVAALLESSIKKVTPDVKKAIKISSDDFIKNVIPGAKSIDVLLENRHTGNFVSLTGGDGPERLFKWNNNFAWSYDGEVTDSVKQRVKAAGGNINAKLRVSLSWFNTDDLDLHANTPLGAHIYYGNKSNVLDVDMNMRYNLVRNPVENLAFDHIYDGNYEIYVNQYRRRETTDFGFTIEVEFEGVLHQYNYQKSLRDQERVPCFVLTIVNGKLTKIDTTLAGGNVSQEKWGVKTETLVPVSSIMYSPNHWNGEAVGAKHLIFALKNCKNPDSTRGIYNEYLRGDLEKHRKVFEVLGAKTKCKSVDDQISGVGFTAARGDSITAIVDGKRSYNIVF